jgi:hypothetical protein
MVRRDQRTIPRLHRGCFHLNDPVARPRSYQVIPPRSYSRRYQQNNAAAFRRSYQAILPRFHRCRFQLHDPAAIRRSYQAILPQPHRRHSQLYHIADGPSAFSRCTLLITRRQQTIRRSSLLKKSNLERPRVSGQFYGTTSVFLLGTDTIWEHDSFILSWRFRSCSTPNKE